MIKNSVISIMGFLLSTGTLACTCSELTLRDVMGGPYVVVKAKINDVWFQDFKMLVAKPKHYFNNQREYVIDVLVAMKGEIGAIKIQTENHGRGSCGINIESNVEYVMFWREDNLNRMKSKDIGICNAWKVGQIKNY